MSEALNNWRKAIDELAQPPAPTAQPASPTHSELPDAIRIPQHKLWADAGYLVGRARAGDVDLAVHRIKALCDEVERAIRAQPVQQPGAEPDGRLHADGYFTWKRRDGYVLDAKLPCDFYLAAPAQRQPLTPSLRRAAEFTRADLGPAGSNYPHVRELLAFAEQALGITAAPAAQKGEKL